MDNKTFDALVRALASGRSRRQVVRGLLGIGAAVGAAGTLAPVEAARRNTPTPAPHKCPGTQSWDGTKCACTTGSTCGPDCCTGGSVCCDNACCFGECYGEELCCPTGSSVCNGECIPGECPSGECSSTADCPSGDYCSSDLTCELCPTCDGEAPFIQCGRSGPDDYCGASCDTDGELFCWEGGLCVERQSCSSNADCSGDEHCIATSCCPGPVCLPLCGSSTQ